ncbi:sulfatase-like hydrolase/transferase [Maribacter sp. ANRC-HE7]|uniref:Sulfatase-like hydrolase/transferase n=1 Tax=Maribacter aquimaris TaxID=2737171 RepID=A0ABR7V5G4_9FLAO|nr:sulfatase-like hydrolase/transferase [Maribacter aquimaris]MBD0779635.1 sulfatase-like hydrolase/transferase [Maribacter aquimaris]
MTFLNITIDERSKVKYVLVYFLVVFGLSCKEKQKHLPEKPISQPNVVLILTDDQGYQDVGIFGSPNIETPHLDQMASEGMKLTNYYAAQAVCSASRAGLLTGCYPNRIGIHNALGPDNTHGINSSETTIAEMLKAQGYKTAIFGKWHLGHYPEFMPNRHGFDEYFGIPYSNDMWPKHPQQGPIFNFPDLPLYENETVIDTLNEQSQLTTQITERSVDFINKNKDNPFFLYVPHPQPHVPLFVSDKFKGKSKRGLYGDVIMEIDWSVGQILEALKKNGLEDNTIVIFTSDNGPWLSYGNHAGSALPYREGKGTAWEGGQREPFIIKYPDKLQAGKIVDVPVMAIDLLPTLAALTDSELPELTIDGKNVWNVISSQTTESPQKAYFFYYRVNELFGVQYGKWKLYFPHRYRTMEGQEPGKDGLPGDYRMVDLEEIELYDVKNDVSEIQNVADEHPEIVAEIKLLANDMRHRLGDSLLELEGTETREPGRIVQK